MSKEFKKKAKKTTIKIASELLTQIVKINEQEAQVIIHCTYNCKSKIDFLSIHENAVLQDENFIHKSNLLHVSNITIYPELVKIRNKKQQQFTLVFSALPKDVTTFHLIQEDDQKEKSTELTEFFIDRNKTDVYHLNF